MSFFQSHTLSSFDELDILKLQTIDTSSLKFKVLDKMADKQKWFDRFRKAYTGCLTLVTSNTFNHITFIVASHGDKEVGFLGLVDETNHFAGVSTQKAFDISFGYVKPAYQSQGILRAMINYVVANHHAKSLTISYERFDYCHPYYVALGFDVFSYMEATKCFRLFLTEMEPLLASMCELVSAEQVVKRFDM